MHMLSIFSFLETNMLQVENNSLLKSWRMFSALRDWMSTQMFSKLVLGRSNGLSF